MREQLVAVMEREVDRWCSTPMQWGVDDCALACANIVRDALGYDPAAPWRTGYTDRDGALQALGSTGLGFALRRVAKEYGWRRVEPMKARAGDIGLLMMPAASRPARDDAAGTVPVTVICKAPGWFVGRSEAGATLLPALNRALPARSIRLAWSPV